MASRLPWPASRRLPFQEEGDLGLDLLSGVFLMGSFHAMDEGGGPETAYLSLLASHHHSLLMSDDMPPPLPDGASGVVAGLMTDFDRSFIFEDVHPQDAFDHEPATTAKGEKEEGPIFPRGEDAGLVSSSPSSSSSAAATPPPSPPRLIIRRNPLRVSRHSTPKTAPLTDSEDRDDTSSDEEYEYEAEDDDEDDEEEDYKRRATSRPQRGRARGSGGSGGRQGGRKRISSGNKKDVEAPIRGRYQCRKCGQAKRAHECLFACNVRSIQVQVDLEITRGDSAKDDSSEMTAGEGEEDFMGDSKGAVHADATREWLGLGLARERNDYTSMSSMDLSGSVSLLAFMATDGGVPSHEENKAGQETLQLMGLIEL